MGGDGVLWVPVRSEALEGELTSGVIPPVLLYLWAALPPLSLHLISHLNAKRAA